MLQSAREDCTVRLTAVLTCRRLQMVCVHLHHQVGFS
jgi:hypothetical protein